MEAQCPSNRVDAFQIEDPLVVFKTYSQEKVQRWLQTDPSFQADLYQEAISLVLNRLKKSKTRTV